MAQQGVVATLDPDSAASDNTIELDDALLDDADSIAPMDTMENQCLFLPPDRPWHKAAHEYGGLHIRGGGL